MGDLKRFEGLSDAGVIRKILAGESALYEILVRRCNPVLYKLGRSYGFNHADVEDLMQEAYLNAYTHIGKFRHRSSFKTWIATIMLHLCYRKKQAFSFKKETVSPKPVNERDIPMFANPSEPDSSAMAESRQVRRAVETALARLPLGFRMVFSLREMNDLSVAQTAKVLDISGENVKVRLSRARKMLRAEIEKLYSPGELFEFHQVYCDRMVARVMKGVVK